MVCVMWKGGNLQTSASKVQEQEFFKGTQHIGGSWWHALKRALEVTTTRCEPDSEIVGSVDNEKQPDDFTLTPHRAGTEYSF